MIVLQKIKKTVSILKLAKTMGVPPTTVYSWKNQIPAWREQAVINALKTLKVDISECEDS